jgi:hypothetical protein
MLPHVTWGRPRGSVPSVRLGRFLPQVEVPEKRYFMNCAMYARVSTTDQNCEMQLRELREYSARRGWKVTEEYVDTGWSGVKASRPALDKLMADASSIVSMCFWCGSWTGSAVPC